MVKENNKIYIVCSHSLDSHIDEGSGWRCHSLGEDGYQCECFLRKDAINPSIDEYDRDKRIEQHKKEFERGCG